MSFSRTSQPSSLHSCWDIVQFASHQSCLFILTIRWKRTISKEFPHRKWFMRDGQRLCAAQRALLSRSLCAFINAADLWPKTPFPWINTIRSAWNMSISLSSLFYYSFQAIESRHSGSWILCRSRSPNGVCLRLAVELAPSAEQICFGLAMTTNHEIPRRAHRHSCPFPFSFRY